MSATLKRLERLHALRSRMADAAGVERKRIAQEEQAAAQAIVALHQGLPAILHGDGGPRLWQERQAMVQVAAGQSRQLLLRRDALHEAAQVAVAAEREAVLAREQMGSIVARVRTEQDREESRREQMRMDDLFATVRVRSSMTTNL